ncbi:transmembrane protein 198-like isoform X2 [Limulus polyphemus]|uniref:Transmembrane protein 198 n=1 Tax=Limulus polyphemus TaxID=6850 RepID=A0ABM1RVM1_LIMPO|nr:transmembrane protein 198-like isoform X2 [Limulus polyphemus]
MPPGDDPTLVPFMNNTVLSGEEDSQCLHFDYNYDITTAVVCGMYLVFGVVYTLYGYRCFKAVMFLTGFIFGSVVVYLICLIEDLLPTAGNSGVALGAGLLFGLITMLVQYVGLFMTGFHMGLFVGVAAITIAYLWYSPTTVWITVGILIGCGLLGAVTTLFFQKGTSIYGGAIIAASADYFIEKFIILHWVWDRVRVVPSLSPCWFSWLILGIWPLMVLVGSLTQWMVTGRGIHHDEMQPSRKTHQLNLQRIRREESRAEQRQRKYRYLYQVRTAHGDVICQSYIQSLQTKVCPPDDSLTTIHSDLTRLTTLNPSSSNTTTLSQAA